MLTSGPAPAHVYGLETMALTEEHQEKGQVLENNWVRTISTLGVRREGERNMDELRVEVGLKERFQKKLVRSRLK